jgi:hypothetical protein
MAQAAHITGPRIRWGVERRMEFIEFRLFWDGHINRSDLTEFFGISVPQASADLASYQQRAPQNLQYDPSAKQYVAGKLFRPIFLSPDSDTYLRQLQSLAAGLIDRENCFAGWLPNFDIVPLPERRVEPHTLFRVLFAIRARQSLRIQYQSMSSTEPRWRWISPHALGFDGFRWHMRSFCHTRNEFRDFLFSRIISVGEHRPSEIEPTHDRLWHEYVTLRIGPNPKLEMNKRKVIELDYGMEDGGRTIKVRGALFFYLCQQLGFHSGAEGSRPAEIQQIVPINWDEAVSLHTQLQARSKASSTS